MRKNTVTPDKLAMIPGMLKQGIKAKEIAEQFGVKHKSLIVICCRNKVSLRDPNRVPKILQRRTLDHPLRLSAPSVELLKEKARAMSIMPATLAQTLLERIIDDDLFTAVLDD
jgi:hypothetical protein